MVERKKSVCVCVCECEKEYMSKTPNYSRADHCLFQGVVFVNKIQWQEEMVCNFGNLVDNAQTPSGR